MKLTYGAFGYIFHRMLLMICDNTLQACWLLTIHTIQIQLISCMGCAKVHTLSGPLQAFRLNVGVALKAVNTFRWKCGLPTTGGAGEGSPIMTVGDTLYTLGTESVMAVRE